MTGTKDGMTSTKIAQKMYGKEYMNMGKHDKAETNFSWEPPKDDFYKARITELKEENARLREANAGSKTVERFAEVYAKRSQELDGKNFDLEDKLKTLQDKYDNAMAYIEKLEQEKFELQSQVDNYEVAILKVVTQI